MDFRVIGISAALGSSASWAVGSILFKRLGEKLSPLGMTLAKGGVSVVFLALALLVTGYNQVDHQSLFLLILSGLLGISIGDTLFFEALQDIGAHSLILLTTFGEVLTIILAVIFLKEQPTPQQWVGIVSVLLGIALVLHSKITNDSQKSQFKWRGIIIGLLSVICMSVSLIIAKQGLASLSAIQATFIRMLSGTVGMFGFGLVTQRLGKWMNPFEDRALIARFLIAVAVVTFGGFWLSLVSLKYIDVAIANILSSTEPLFVLPLAAIFLKEKITTQALIGNFVAVFGIILICTP
ncbi:DMT family transporter [Anabaena sp. FACHB-1237]|uniref:DMT family transporter n=1 Tax=Anabaena sp. FACHB-1237 TaxID=2692769 RepID=UPI001680679E|nr:DMT family transporter [Anabaena sp. FACHB-1237]MBD2138251.1 DMT family transporter [Anabaena sp. FACHB-1237]